jgi:hypothetical protein
VAANPTPDDLLEFLRLLQGNHVDFVLVGGYAVAFHGYIRSTQDLDILYRNTPGNRQGITQALLDFGFPKQVISDDLFQAGSILRMGLPPSRIEMLNEVSGVSVDEIWQHRVLGDFEGLKVHFISLDDLRKNKKAAGRAKDLLDLAELQD